MKKILLLIAVPFILHFAAFSQSCLPEGITFTTQEQIDNFQSDYPGCTEIEGDVGILGVNISNLEALHVLSNIGGDLWILNTEALTSLTGLNNIISIGGYLLIQCNIGLVNLSGLESLSSIGGSFEMSLNPALTDIVGLNNLSAIGRELFIFGNNTLVSLNGLGKLTFVTNLWIRDNDFLTNLTGLNNLTSIEETLTIRYNDALINLTGLENLTSVGSSVFIQYNDALANMTSLENLSFVGEDIWIGDNSTLTSLAGLENIEANTIGNLIIIKNSSLTTCEVLSICSYLANPNGVITIYDNKEGCNSTEEIEDACNAGIEDEYIESPVSIFPNPAKNELFVSANAGMEILKINIYNQTGQMVLKQGLSTETIDISMLKPGIYIIEVGSDELMIREKLVVR